MSLHMEFFVFEGIPYLQFNLKDLNDKYNYALLFGWSMLGLSLLLNGIYYKLHPMRLPMSPKGKLQTHLCGVLTCTCWTESEEEFDGKYLVLFDFFYLRNL